MRFLIPLIILLMSAICSCSSSRQTATQTADSTRAELSEVTTSMSADHVLSKLTSSTDINLTGITVEFYPPHTTHPDAKSSPKTLKIETAAARNATAAARQAVRTAVNTDSITATLEQAAALSKTTSTDADILHPCGAVVIIALLGAAAILAIILIIRHRQSP